MNNNYNVAYQDIVPVCTLFEGTLAASFIRSKSDKPRWDFPEKVAPARPVAVGTAVDDMDVVVV